MRVLPSGVPFPSPRCVRSSLEVPNILREPAFQVAFVNCNDVIQEITPATPYPTLCDSILPRTHPQGSNRCGDFQSILGITIKETAISSITKDASRIRRSKKMHLSAELSSLPRSVL